MEGYFRDPDYPYISAENPVALLISIKVKEPGLMINPSREMLAEVANRFNYGDPHTFFLNVSKLEKMVLLENGEFGWRHFKNTTGILAVIVFMTMGLEWRWSAYLESKTVTKSKALKEAMEMDWSLNYSDKNFQKLQNFGGNPMAIAFNGLLVNQIHEGLEDIGIEL